MEKIAVQIEPADGTRSYSVTVGSGVLGALAAHISVAQFSRIFVVVDAVLAPTIGQAILKQLPPGTCSAALDGGESSKRLDALADLWSRFLDAGLDRSSLVLNIGGGMIGDLAGFAASTYMRGIAFAQIPTTLLSQVDASVGGKVAINHGGVKNIVGSFQQPIAVLIDVDTLNSLPDRDYRSGFAEILKHGVIADRSYFDEVRALPAGRMRSAVAEQVIARSVRIKSAVVGRDEREAGARKLLNFGHTIGHALEAASAKNGTTALLHGEAISIGMIAEAKLSVLNGLLQEQDLALLEGALAAAGLPLRFSGDAPDSKLLELIEHDKKNSAGTVRWTLLKRLGEGIVDQIASPDAVGAALRYIRHG